MRTIFFLLLATGMTCMARAEVRLAEIFNDHMVLQRDRPVPVWGWAEAGRAVTVKFGSQTKTTRTGENGRWKVMLDPLPTSELPQNLMVSAQTSVAVVKDVVVGEVWLCAGQSNMGMTVKNVRNAEKEIKAANFPLIRMYFVRSPAASTPQEHGQGLWHACAPRTVPNFSATAYFFGRALHQRLKVPVGLIHASAGGTKIEAWTSLAAMEKAPELQPLLDRWRRDVAVFEQPDHLPRNEAAKKEWQDAVKAAISAKQPLPPTPAYLGRDPLHPNRPGNLFNGKIAPLIPFAFRGTIWYQGEANVANGPLYAVQLPLLIQDWRTRWGADFPFAWVQLPNFMKREPDPDAASTWARLREAQSQALSVPKTGMTVNIDLGDQNDVHAKNKQEIGHRLALWARAEVYGEKIEWSGPRYQSHAIRSREVVIQFSHAQGLKTKDGGAAVNGFALADGTHHWRWADARIEGGQVIVSHPEIESPAAVRYAWANNPEVNLVNAAGLPTAPFRTDDWPMDRASRPQTAKAGAE
ncbi:MAG: sialate O-acetylesterase [Prosthecobacter sp.]|uniref:sialate O-acetylesterase n=1 Tax=Prosthecobacter sp. TaxID=1965333 RepID=UPI001A0DA026|nr:sialate O-acetylesterase [Prosthecobacter sp.]MBE2284001.1 sialate O-acetylesterase [Prosthecobacter sp.]